MLAQNTSTGRSDQIAITNGRMSQTENDQEAEKCREEDEANNAKIKTKNGLENCYDVTMKNVATEGQLKFKFEAGDKEKTEKAVQDAEGWLDRKPLAEKDDFVAVL